MCKRRPTEDGTVLLITMNVIVILVALGAAFLSVSYSENREGASAEQRMRSLYVAEAAVNESLADLQAGGNGVIGSSSYPRLFSGGQFHVSVTSLGSGSFGLLAKATLGTDRTAIEAVVGPSALTSYFRTAVLSGTNLDLISSPTVDSYDSSTGDYSTQTTNNHAGRPYARPKGDVEANGDINFGISSSIFGNLMSGGMLPSISGGNFVLGSTTSQSADRTMPPIVLPPTASMAPTVLSSNNGNTLLPSGAYHFSSFLLDGTANITIQGPATLVVDDFRMKGNSIITIESSMGPVFVYCTGRVKVDGQSAIFSSRKLAHDLMFFIATDNMTPAPLDADGATGLPILLTGGSTTNGVLYAPNGVVRIEGTSEVFGAVAGKRVRLKDQAYIHFDEALARSELPMGDSGQEAGAWTSQGGGTGPEVTLRLLTWRRTSPDATCVASGSSPSGGTTGAPQEDPQCGGGENK